MFCVADLVFSTVESVSKKYPDSLPNLPDECGWKLHPERKRLRIQNIRIRVGGAWLTHQFFAILNKGVTENQQRFERGFPQLKISLSVFNKDCIPLCILKLFSGPNTVNIAVFLSVASPFRKPWRSLRKCSELNQAQFLASEEIRINSRYLGWSSVAFECVSSH